MGHHLQGEVHGGMTLVIACRGPPGRSEQGYFTAVWLPVGRGFPRGVFLRLAVLRRPASALFSGAPQVRPNCARFGHWARMCDSAVNLLDAGFCRGPYL